MAGWFTLVMIIMIFAGCVKLSGHGTVNDEGYVSGAVTIPVELPVGN